jgi:protein TonB
MLNQTTSSPTASRFSLKKLPWVAFGIVLLVHICVLWWLMGAYFGRVPEDSAQPIFVTLEVGEPEPAAPLPADASTEEDPSQPEPSQPLEVPVDLVLDKVVKQPVAPAVPRQSTPDQKQKEKRASSLSAPSPVTSSQLTQLADPGPRLVTRVQYLSEPPRPVYPAYSKSRKQQGKVIVRVLISPEGLIRTIQIHQSSGFDALDEAAIRAFTDVRFKPYSENGIPFDRLADIPIEFMLRN